MTTESYRTGPLNRSKYVIRKTCRECGGDGGKWRRDSNGYPWLSKCAICEGKGSLAVDPDAAYFVLRVDGECDPHARKALAVYADSVEVDNPVFADSIRKWLVQLRKETMRNV